MRPFRLIVLVVVLAVAAMGAIGGILYLMDYAVEANVKSTQCQGGFLGGENTVTVQTKLFAIEYTLTGVPAQQCAAIHPGNFVKYHLRTSRTSLYETEGGACIYDSVGGVAGCDR